jgi:hypothetical protein
MGVQIAGNILVQSNGDPLPIAMGGTGQTTASAAINALLPSQTGNSNKVLKTDGTNVSWVLASGAAGGSDTQIQYNDSGNFAGSSNFTINKSTGAITAASTVTTLGTVINGAAATVRPVKYQSAASDRWFLQVNSAAESGAAAGSNFEIVRLADNGSTQNVVLDISRATGVVDFKVAPTVNGSAITGGVTSFTAGTTGFTPSSATTGAVTLAGTLNVANGGTGATTASTARSNLSAAASGANSDITSISGLTTALTVAQGGTGATTANTAFNNLVPSQVTHSGKFLTTNGTDTSWATVSASPGGSNTQIQYNSSGSFAGSASFTYNGTSDVTLGNGTTAGSLTFASTSGDTTAVIKVAETTGGKGHLTVAAGDAQASGSQGGGNLTLKSGAPGAASGGGSNAGSNVFISAGAGGGSLPTGGYITLSTATTDTLTERFRILANGAWSVGSNGTSYGTSGQVLTSNGNAAPTWQSAATGTVTSVGVSSSGTYSAALTVGSSPVTSSGTITITPNLFGSSAAGVVPSSGGGTTNFLRADGTWAVPPASTFTGGTITGATTYTAGVASTSVSTGTLIVQGGIGVSGNMSFTTFTETVPATITSSATQALDCATGTVFNITLSTSITSLTFSNVPASGRVYTMTLIVTQAGGGSKTITWPAAVKWPNTTAPTLTTTSTKVDILTLMTPDGGTTWYGFVAGQNF